MNATPRALALSCTLAILCFAGGCESMRQSFTGTHRTSVPVQGNLKGEGPYRVEVQSGTGMVIVRTNSKLAAPQVRATVQNTDSQTPPDWVAASVSRVNGRRVLRVLVPDAGPEGSQAVDLVIDVPASQGVEVRARGAVRLQDIRGPLDVRVNPATPTDTAVYITIDGELTEGGTVASTQGDIRLFAPALTGPVLLRGTMAPTVVTPRAALHNVRLTQNVWSGTIGELPPMDANAGTDTAAPNELRLSTDKGRVILTVHK